MSRDWSREEVEAAVADYLEMLTSEIQGLQYSKTEHRRKLSKLLRERNDGAIERKHQNISAILLRLNHPWILGYKPLGNYQQLLFDIVAERISQSRMQAVISEAVQMPVSAPKLVNLNGLEVPRPEGWAKRHSVDTDRVKETGRRLAPDHFQREANNASLGLAGEQFVLEYEKARLRSAGRDSLADQVEHVALTEGGSAGFDIHSYESNGADRLVEVKTTNYAKEVPFYLTKNELATSVAREKHYQLYRVFQFKIDAHFFRLEGRIDKNCDLDPQEFLCHVVSP